MSAKSLVVLAPRRQSLGGEPVPRQRGPNEAAMLLILHNLKIYLRNQLAPDPWAQAGQPANPVWAQFSPERTHLAELYLERLRNGIEPSGGFEL
jgi:hypothetical protein